MDKNDAEGWSIMELNPDEKPVSRKARNILWIARIAGTIILVGLGFILLGEAFDDGIITGITFIAPFIVGFILFFTWDRWKIVRIPGIIGIALPELFLLFKMVSGAVQGVEPNEVTPIFAILMMLLGVFLALKWEGFGGMFAIVGWIGFVIGYYFRDKNVMSLSLVLSPLLVIGGLYVLYWKITKNSKLVTCPPHTDSDVMTVLEC